MSICPICKSCALKKNFPPLILDIFVFMYIYNIYIVCFYGQLLFPYAALHCAYIYLEFIYSK